MFQIIKEHPFSHSHSVVQTRGLREVTEGMGWTMFSCVLLCEFRWLSWLSQMSCGGFTVCLCGEMKQRTSLCLRGNGRNIIHLRKRCFPLSLLFHSLRTDGLLANSRGRLENYATAAFKIRHHQFTSSPVSSFSLSLCYSPLTETLNLGLSPPSLRGCFRVHPPVSLNTPPLLSLLLSLK